jgi:glycosyltransferase involved in cell wall biosynthesis
MTEAVSVEAPTGSDVPALRIAMIAPPWFAVPPVAYGGIEHVVADLVDGLVGHGHDVTLISAGEHGTNATRHIRTFDEPPSERLGETLPDAVHARLAQRIVASLAVDVVHDHSQVGPLLAAGRAVPTVVTAHGATTGFPGQFLSVVADDCSLVAISEAQRRSTPLIPWAGMVHNALDVGTFPFRDTKDDFLLFLGRLHPEKAPHLAIDAARAAGRRIVVAGKCVEPIERRYREEFLVPRGGPDVDFVGTADAAAKRELLAGAAALLFPITWEEPFGMVMAEAMACGTPVIAFRRGAVPEVVVDGVTGYIVDTFDEFVAAIARAGAIDAAACRDHVARTFPRERMASGYEAVYRQAIARPIDLTGAGPVTRAAAVTPRRG